MAPEKDERQKISLKIPAHRKWPGSKEIQRLCQGTPANHLQACDGSNYRGGLRRKRWWNSKVKAALQAQRLANCQHWPAVNILSEQRAQEAWREYQGSQEWLHGTKRAFINKLEEIIKDRFQEHPPVLAGYFTV